MKSFTEFRQELDEKASDRYDPTDSFTIGGTVGNIIKSTGETAGSAVKKIFNLTGNVNKQIPVASVQQGSKPLTTEKPTSDGRGIVKWPIDKTNLYKNVNRADFDIRRDARADRANDLTFIGKQRAAAAPNNGAPVAEVPKPVKIGDYGPNKSLGNKPDPYENTRTPDIYNRRGNNSGSSSGKKDTPTAPTSQPVQRQVDKPSERKGSVLPPAAPVARPPVASKPAAPVSSGKPVTTSKSTEADPNLNPKYQVGVTATASKEPSGKMNFSNVKRGSTIPDNIQNMYNKATELKRSDDVKRADIYTQSANRLLAKSNITQPASSTQANPNLQSKISDVAKSEFKPGSISKLFPSNAKPIPRFENTMESAIDFLSKKSSWNRNSNIEIIEDIKIELNDLFNTLEESKYTNELLERKLKNVMERYSLTEDQLHYLISKFLDEGLLGGIAKWVGLPALGFLAATHGQDFINHFKSLQNKPSTEVSKEIKPAPELKEPISQKTLTAAKKSDKLEPKLAALSDVSKSVTSAADKAASGMEAASKKIDQIFGKKK